MGEGREELAHAHTERAGDVVIPAAHTDVPVAGERIGRFVAGDVLGSGGMAVVLSAHDPDLGRDVALKLVRAGTGSSDSSDGRARLLREARALARLRHDNVLTVYEAGTHGDRVYIAVEKVSGGTLSDVVRGGALGWEQIVDVFAAAGEGLAAAHRAGLVHRDFKPANVLVDDDRVLVADFGLVAPSRSPAARAGDPETLAELPLGEPITRDGEVVGTPTYMAPEQHYGEAVDARTDQFAFCVALYKALYGKLPFRGRTRRDYVRAIAANAVEPTPPDSDVPPWIRDAIVRGLSHEAEDRWPSMDALLAELRTDPHGARAWARHRTLLLGVITAAVVGWAGVSTFVDYQLTYPAMAIIDGGILALIGLSAIPVRRALRVRYNRMIFLIGAATVAATLMMILAAYVAGMPSHHAALLHLFTVFCFGSATAILLDYRLTVVAVGYLAAFMATAFSPGLFYPASFLSHGTMAITLLVVVGDLGRR